MQSKSEHPVPPTRDVILTLVPGGERRLTHLSDCELLANTRRLVGESNRLFAQLLLHLAEVEARGVHRSRACSSLYSYCIYELRFSEDAAARRVSAAKLVKRFPALFEAVERGELHLTGLLMIGPHLTLENHEEVLQRAKFRSKKELARLVRELAPLPRVLDVIEPLGPELPSPSPATWERFASSLAPRVRELPEGQRPSDWLAEGDREDASRDRESDEASFAPALANTLGLGSAAGAILLPVAHAARSQAAPASAPAWAEAASGSAVLSAPVAPLRFGMQFTTTEEHVQLIERARTLLARQAPITRSALHVEAMKLLVAALEKRKFAAHSKRKAEAQSDAISLSDGFGAAESTEQARDSIAAGASTPAATRSGALRTPRGSQIDPATDKPSSATRVAGRATLTLNREMTEARSSESHKVPARRTAFAHGERHPSPALKREMTEACSSESHKATARRTAFAHGERHPTSAAVVEAAKARGEPERHHESSEGGAPRPPSRQRGRYVKAAVRRAVFERDGSRCTYHDERGERCRETRYLELHHRAPYARGGEQTLTNLTLHCFAHNALVAELDFGRDNITKRRDAATHEPLSSQRS